MSSSFHADYNSVKSYLLFALQAFSLLLMTQSFLTKPENDETLILQTAFLLSNCFRFANSSFTIVDDEESVYTLKAIVPSFVRIALNILKLI